uniref:Acyl-CoA thioesterase 11b n=1 Tax=Takifugu rubripes TaxID=31033 RepID=A0A674MQ56_TAKRU
QASESSVINEGYRNPTELKMSQIVLPCHANHRGELSVGQLLKWMDSTACLSAERHAGCSCITASVDDIHFELTIGVGKVVNIIAKVNRAFSSSMEVGILVNCEDLYTDRQWKVCQAFATFVARRTEAGKVQLKQVIPRTQLEQMEYSLAAERRRMRLLHAEIITDLLSSSTAQPECQEYQDAVPAEQTRVESVELVLPPHTNHQVSTFGGQIMAWMENVATISARCVQTAWTILSPATPWRTLRCSRSRWVSSFSTSFQLRMLRTPPHRAAQKADGQMTSPGSSHRGAQFSSLRMASQMSELLNVCLRVS